MAAFFLAPNMLIFGIFVLFPLVINFAYSMTGGGDLFLSDRVFVGADQYRRLFDCGNYLDAGTCAEDLFWTAVWNTAFFVVLQVAIMVGVALVTALVLNRELKARSFWRAVFFFPVLLSPVVVGLIWRWILQREGLLNSLNVEMTDRGNVKRDANFATSVPGVYVAGDMGRGQSLIVWAIAEGRAAAAGVDRYLMGNTALPAPIKPTAVPQR